MTKMKREKNNHYQKMWAIVISLVLVLALLPATVSAEGKEQFIQKNSRSQIIAAVNEGQAVDFGAEFVNYSAELPPQTGDNHILILLLSAAAITCLVVMYVMRYNKSRWYGD
jgi:hypothetical protein